MSSLRELHDMAMDRVDQALRERGFGNAKRSQVLFERELELEMGAISKLPKQYGLIWSVLHRSAGTPVFRLRLLPSCRVPNLQSTVWRARLGDRGGVARASGRSVQSNGARQESGSL